jgi:hypothetical protein
MLGVVENFVTVMPVDFQGFKLLLGIEILSPAALQ